MKRIFVCGLTFVSLLLTSCSENFVSCEYNEILEIISDNNDHGLPDVENVTYTIKIDTLKITGSNQELIDEFNKQLKDVKFDFGKGVDDLEFKEGASTSYSESFSESGLKDKRMNKVKLGSYFIFYKGNNSTYELVSGFSSGTDEVNIELITYEYYNKYNLPYRQIIDMEISATDYSDDISIDYSISLNIAYN